MWLEEVSHQRCDLERSVSLQTGPVSLGLVAPVQWTAVFCCAPLSSPHCPGAGPSQTLTRIETNLSSFKLQVSGVLLRDKNATQTS